MRMVVVPIVKISVGHNRRPISPAAVKSLMGSISEIGLQNPIGLTENYRLIHGRHRLEACNQLGWTEIPASIHDIDDLHAQLAEIDENIQRKQLSKVDEVKALAKRKKLYLALHPETKHGGAPGNKGRGRGKAKRIKTDKMSAFKAEASFASDTAAKTGRTERSVRRDVALGDALPDEIVEKIAGTPVANKKSELKKLAELDATQQAAVVDLIAEGTCKSVTEALSINAEPTDQPDASEILEQRVMKAVDKWRKEYGESASAAAAVLKRLSRRLTH